MLSESNKPLLRWVIGGTIPQGIHLLKESITRTSKVFGDRFDYMVCYNNMAFEDLKFIARIFPFVTLYKQNWMECPIANQMPITERDSFGNIKTDVYSCGGSLWKLCPARMRINAHEIIMDNDLVFFKAMNQVEEFLLSSRPILLKEHTRWFGVYDKLFVPGDKFNSGFVGLPPEFDYETKLRDAWKSAGSLCNLNYADEQGLITYVLRQNDPIMIEIDDIVELHQMGMVIHSQENQCFIKHDFIEKNKAAHFVQANRNFPHHPWCKYKNECIKLS